MPEKPHNFWQELKRRKVVRVITVYAAAAFVILELVDIVATPLGLPAWTLNFVIVLLCVGLILSIILSWIYDITPEGIQKTQSVSENDTGKKGKVTTGWKISTYISILVIIAFVLFYFINSIKKSSNISRLEKTIAVLPFENWNSDDEYMHMGDAIANEINTQLSKIKEFHVFSYTSTKQFKDPDKPPVPVIGKKLGANFIIEGTVERQKEYVSIHVQVIQAESDNHLWAEEFKGKWEDIFTIRAEIAVRIAEELKTALSPEEIRKIKKNPTENPEAYNLYLKGRFFWNKRTAEGFQTGIEYFHQAIEKDPAYSLAYAGIADCYNLLGWHDLFSPDEVHPKAKAAAEKALMMDETLSEAHASLAYVKMLYDWDWQVAGQEFKRALELNPNYAEAHQWYSEYLAYMGRLDESIAEAELAQELDPLSLSISHNLGLIFYEAHQFDLAIEKYLKTIEMDPGFIVTYNYLGLAYAGKKMYNEAITNVQKAIDLTEEQSPLYIGTLGFIYASMGNKNEAEKILEHLVELSQQRYIAPVSLAIICGTLGLKDQAFEWMEKGYEVRDDFMMVLKVEPRLDSLRSDPRYQNMMERMKLSD